MRRAFGRFFPILLLALAVQLLAPVGICFAASVAIADPLRGAALCSGSDASQAEVPNALHHMRDGSCAACCAAAGAPPPTPALTPSPVEREAYRVAWRAFLPGTLAARAVSIAQPRGPPTLS